MDVDDEAGEMKRYVAVRIDDSLVRQDVRKEESWWEFMLMVKDPDGIWRAGCSGGLCGGCAFRPSCGGKFGQLTFGTAEEALVYAAAIGVEAWTTDRSSDRYGGALFLLDDEMRRPA